MQSFKFCSMLVLWGASLSSLRAAEPISFAKVTPLLKQHCLNCHGSTVDKPKGELRIDKLNTNEDK